MSNPYHPTQDQQDRAHFAKNAKRRELAAARRAADMVPRKESFACLDCKESFDRMRHGNRPATERCPNCRKTNDAQRTAARKRLRNQRSDAKYLGLEKKPCARCGVPFFANRGTPNCCACALLAFPERPTYGPSSMARCAS